MLARNRWWVVEHLVGLTIYTFICPLYVYICNDFDDYVKTYSWMIISQTIGSFVFIYVMDRSDRDVFAICKPAMKPSR